VQTAYAVEPRLLTPEKAREAITITDTRTRQLMKTVEMLPKGSEIILHHDTHAYHDALVQLVKRLRVSLMPDLHFSDALVLRGTLGNRIPGLHTDPTAVVFNVEERQFYFCVALIHDTSQTGLESRKV
jgi:hypothetical protein